jgi:N-acetylglucosamine malate deacetylase 1
MTTPPKRLLVLAPHTDDAELGCGGTIAKMIRQQVEVRILAFSRAEDSVPPGAPKDMIEQEMRKSLHSLGIPASAIEVLGLPVRIFPSYRQEILERLVAVRREFAPDWVLTVSEHDIHQDHQVIHQESVRAFNATRLWGYELPWNNLKSELNGFVLLSEEDVAAKARALGHYQSQIELKRPYFTEKFTESLAMLRGLQARSAYAEAFQIIRERQ